MKNILVISASPRKGGNSDLLCDQFAKGAREAGHEVEKVRLAERKVGYGTGAYEKGAVRDMSVFQEAYLAGKSC